MELFVGTVAAIALGAVILVALLGGSGASFAEPEKLLYPTAAPIKQYQAKSTAQEIALVG